MLDTVVLVIEQGSFTIQDPARFRPHAGTVLANAQRGIMSKAVYNQKSNGDVCFPRLTLLGLPIKGRMRLCLQIEVSVSKLLFGNNYLELIDSDFDRVLYQLCERLQRMGVDVSPVALLNAKVSAAHFSKNFRLPDGIPTCFLLNLLAKVDLSQKLDLNRTDFRNGGQMVKYHGDSYEVAFYDKKKDVQHTGLHAGERNELSLYGLKDMPQTLRYEVRLRGAKLQEVLKTVSGSSSVVFDKVFCMHLSQKVLLYYWRQIKEGLYILNLNADQVADLYVRLKTFYPRKSPLKLLQLAGFSVLADSIGVCAARHMSGLRPVQYYALKKDLKVLSAVQAAMRKNRRTTFCFSWNL